MKKCNRTWIPEQQIQPMANKCIIKTQTYSPQTCPSKGKQTADTFGLPKATQHRVVRLTIRYDLPPDAEEFGVPQY